MDERPGETKPVNREIVSLTQLEAEMQCAAAGESPKSALVSSVESCFTVRCAGQWQHALKDP
jgi:hypothetical protein